MPSEFESLANDLMDSLGVKDKLYIMVNDNNTSFFDNAYIGGLNPESSRGYTDILKNQGTINGLYFPDKPLIQNRKVITLGSNLNSKNFKESLMNTLVHELGHHIDYTLIREKYPNIHNDLLTEFKDWAKKTKKSYNEDEFISVFKSGTEKLDGLNDPTIGSLQSSEAAKQWSNDYREWFAENFTKWARSNAKPQTIVEKYFKDLVVKLKEFYKVLQSKKEIFLGQSGKTVKTKDYLPNQTLSDFLNSISTTVADQSVQKVFDPVAVLKKLQKDPSKLTKEERAEIEKLMNKKN